MDAGFVLALPFHHGDIEPDCVGVSTREGELISARLCAKNVGGGGGLCVWGGVFAGHYGISMNFVASTVEDVPAPSGPSFPTTQTRISLCNQHATMLRITI